MAPYLDQRVLVTLKIFLCVFLSMDLEVQGLKLAYEEILPPSGGKGLPDVIMMHGLRSWKKELKYLAIEIAKNTGRKVYTLDARNHGDSPWSEEMSISSLSDDLDEFMTDHNITKAVIFGHSMGGKTGIMLATKNPEKVEKLIVEDIGVKNISKRTYEDIQFRSKLIDEMLDSIIITDEEEENDLLYRLFRPLLKQLRSLDVSMIPIKRDGDKYKFVANPRTLSLFTLENINQKLTGVFPGEALFLYGTKSPFRVAEDDTIQQYFPKARLFPFVKGSHILHHQFPEKFAQVVSDFINSETI